MSERHGLPKINILTPDGKLNENVPERFRGLDVKTARERVIEELTSAGLFIRSEEHTHQVGHCYRCATVIEPYLSTQWFVRMRGMADKALDAWKNDRIRFFPKRWENTYTHWLSNIRDWCISRQLWWGHRIPVWYCEDCGEMMVLRGEPSSCAKCGGANLRQDNDVLDTWFSSWLWPFSTLGWPDDTHDLKVFFPTTTLVTAYDIIFFWVSRMIMASLEFMGEVPFRDIYITGLVRDKQGRKMSKSLGNGMDPLEIVDEFGADSLKFTLCFLAAQGQDVLVDKESFKFGSKFANKIWNASRYLLMNLEGKTIIPLALIQLKDVDRWIFHRLNEAVKRVRDAVPQYRFNEAAQAVYEFFWNDFCDWYIEASKLSLYSDDQKEKDRAISLLVHVLEESMRLLHPFLSFITEEIYQKLPKHGPQGESIINAPYPEVRQEREDEDIALKFASLQDCIRSVRTLRSEFTIPPEKKIRVTVKTDPGFASSSFFASQRSVVESLAGIGELSFTETKPDAAGGVALPGNGFEVYVFVRDVIDIPKQVEKLGKEAANLEKLIAQTRGKLSNEQFLSHAPEDVVRKEKRSSPSFRNERSRSKAI
jgi:valyl-tRNA synthetase